MPSNPILILSAHRSGIAPEDNAARHEQLGAFLLAGGFIAEPVTGSYGGSREAGYLVALPVGPRHWEAYETLCSLAAAFGQESVLYVGRDGTATLVYLRPSGEAYDCRPIGRTSDGLYWCAL